MFGLTVPALITTTIFYSANPCATDLEFYPKSGTVVELETATDTVVVEDRSGNFWSFEGIEDWMIDDHCAMIMCNNGTSEISDDIICKVIYER